MNAKRGFFRITAVASIAVGMTAMLGSSKPSFDDFRWRPATEVENGKAKQWEARGDARPFDPDMYIITIAHKVLKENQGAIRLEFGARYYVLPFAIGFLATWIGYAIIRFLVIGYVIQGFRR